MRTYIKLIVIVGAFFALAYLLAGLPRLTR